MQLTEQGRRLRRDVAWNLVPVVLLAAVGLGLNFAIGGWWGPAALGTFNQVTIALFALAVVGAGGLQFAVLRAIAEQPDDPERVAAVVVGALVPNVVLAAVTTVVFLAIREPIGRMLGSPAVAEGVRWAAPALFCFALNKVLLAVVNARRRMRAFAVYTALRYLLIAAGLGVARGYRLSAEQLPVIWTLAEGGLLLVLVGELVATVPLARSRGWLGWAWRHVDYGARSVLATLAFEVNSKLDVWMLGIALPDSQVGIYALAASLFEGATQLAVVLQNNVNPLIARHLAAGEPREVDALVRRTRRWFVPALIGCAALGALGYPIVVPWLTGNPAFAAGSASFAILMAAMAVASPWLPFNQVLLMAARPGWHTVYMVVTLGIAFVGLKLLIPALALEGAALAMAAALIGSVVLLRWLARQLADVRL